MFVPSSRYERSHAKLRTQAVYFAARANKRMRPPRMSPPSSLTDYAVFGSAPPPVFIFLASGAPDPFPFGREIKERYALASILGRGSFGDVILAFDKIICQKLAIKRIKTTPEEGNLELNVLKTIDHPCVLRLLDHMLTPDDTFLVLQFCEGGPLSGVVFPKRTLNECEVKTVFYQLTLALQYLHDIGIVHRDIKASILLDNILLFSKEPETLIKLIDFGASNCSGSLALGTPIGSSLYVAPEVLRASLVGSNYCHQADVWSAGVVLFLWTHTTLGGYQPFLDHNSILNGDFNLEPSVWDKVSPPARDLVQRMLEVDPRLRISVKHILGHKWMKDSRLKSKVHSLMKAEIKHWRECYLPSSFRECKKRDITTPTIEQPNDNIGLVVRAPGYSARGCGFDSWRSVKQ
uniref:Protein kinase domain-containing protein n=1 Tax=Timema genevievae TaxID=629358 RepID=A0A7R9K537_TIMGE|nr:unnamed protein product [Timema genevievae]